MHCLPSCVLPLSRSKAHGLSGPHAWLSKPDAGDRDGRARALTVLTGAGDACVVSEGLEGPRLVDSCFRPCVWWGSLEGRRCLQAITQCFSE